MPRWSQAGAPWLFGVVLALVLGAGEARAASFVDSVHSLHTAAMVHEYADLLEDSLADSGALSFDDSISTLSDSQLSFDEALGTASLGFAFSSTSIDASAGAGSDIRGDSASAWGTATVDLLFEVDQPTPYTATGSITSTEVPSEAHSEQQAFFDPYVQLLDALDQPIFEQSLGFDPVSDAYSNNDFQLSGSLAPGVYTLRVYARAYSGGSPFKYPDVNASSGASVSLSLLPEPASGLLQAVALLVVAGTGSGRRWKQQRPRSDGARPFRSLDSPPDPGGR